MSSATPRFSTVLPGPAASSSRPGPVSRPAIVAAFVVVYLVWGSTFYGIRVAVESLPPLTMASCRFLLAGGILLLASARVRPRPTLREWGNAAAVGALFFLCNHGLVSSAARFIPSSLACLIIATEVPIIAVLSSLFLGQPLTRAGLFGAALGLAGVVSLFGGSGFETSALLASLAVLGASFSWGLGAVLSQKLQFPPDAVLRSGMQMICGGAMLAGASLVSGEPFRTDFAAVSQRSLVALAYLVAFGSVLAFACYSFLLKNVRTDAVATHVFVNPLVAVVIGSWLGGEQLRPVHLIAGLLILGSVSVILFGQQKRGSERAVKVELPDEAAGRTGRVA